MTLNKSNLLFLIIFLEGYVVLACELIAIRTLVPFVGSGTEVISIVISAVLLPLAIGYHVGGSRFQKAKANRKDKVISLRKILLKNLISSMIPLGLGLSYIIQEIFFGFLNVVGISHHIPQTAIFCLLFLVYPVFLLAQTIPLLSNYFSNKHLSAITGKMLMFSTVGSFAGSVFSTIVLMMTIGVHYTLIFTIGTLVVVVLLLTRRVYEFDNVIAMMIFGVVFALNNSVLLAEFNVVANNQYSMVKIHDDKANDRKVMDINRSNSSAYSSDFSKRFEYVKWIESNILQPKLATEAPKNILILGAGGFTMGVDDNFNNYTYVDIDASLKHVSEKYFLPAKLGDNKEFVPMSVRAFLARASDKYDVIVIDLYTNIMSIPMEAVTREFFVECKKRLAKGGVLVSNLGALPNFSNKFSVRYNNTFRSVFPYFTSQVMHTQSPWSKQADNVDNILYVYHNRSEQFVDDVIYTDNLNSYSIDR